MRMLFFENLAVKYYKYYVSHRYHVKTLKIFLAWSQTSTQVYAVPQKNGIPGLPMKVAFQNNGPPCPSIVPASMQQTFFEIG